MARDYQRGARQSLRAEQKRRQARAPLLEAAGVLPALPTVAELAAKREAADQAAPARWAEFEALARARVERYRAAIAAEYGAEALRFADFQLQEGASARLGPEYHADHYCAALAKLSGATKLDIFNRLRGV